ncbi:hypothetical protein GMD78_19530 [Ornithinibacillus sp. L9]|uniref:Uncharacterized protein n=1 Tax=Ornithinibacillus caprae TaxID=2678566 RepID=A0A6N8FLN5_9BACI|nr:hypothetical protein [Ornithinibacillus caprae]MUK90552.1 hypothetical protein [Ornithinibacillus caprae]
MKIINEIIYYLIVVIIGGLMGGVVLFLYSKFGIDGDAFYVKLGMVGVFILLFVIEQNKLKFTRWSPSKNSEELSHKSTKILKLISVALITIPIVIHFAI